LKIKYVIGNPCVSAESARHRIGEGERFKDMAEHDNHITKSVLPIADELMCVGCMGMLQLAHVDYLLIDAPNGATWVLSSEPVHPSILHGKTINLHAGVDQKIQCIDCTPGHNITDCNDTRFVNIDLGFWNYEPISLTDILKNLPANYQ